MTATTPASPSTGGNLIAGCCAILSFFFALCTIFTLIIAAADAITDARHAHWPIASATLLRSEVAPYTSSRRNGGRYDVDLMVRFAVAEDQYVTARIRTAPAYQEGGTPVMREWVERHPVGSRVPVRYDGSHPATAELTDAEGLIFARHTRVDLQLALMAFAGGIVTFSLARVLRPRGVVSD